MSSKRNTDHPPVPLGLSDHFQRPIILLPILSALTFTIYFTTLSFNFVWDDLFQIVDNPLIRSWRGVSRAFMSDLWFHVSRGQLYYRPLFTTWSVLNYAVFSLKPWGWHLAAILLHVIAVCVVYSLARKLKLPHWTAAIAAVLFAVHPIHIETVAWVSAASDTMVTIFCMLAFIAFLNSREPSQSRKMFWRVLSFLLLACALLTKEMAATFCLLVGLYAWLFPAVKAAPWRRIRDSIAIALPYAGLTLGYVVLRKFALHQLVEVLEHHTAGEVLLTLPSVLAFYLRLLFMPVGLTGLYYTPYITRPEFGNFVLPVAVLIGFVALIWCWQQRTKDREIGFLALWALITLAPALYLPNFGNGDFVRDRYFYLPSVGLIILAAKAIRLLPSFKNLTASTVQVGFTSVVGMALIVGCTQQIYWANELLIFERGHSLYPANNYASVGLARVLGRSGSNARALPLLKEAIRQKPENPAAYFLLAEVYARAGQNEEGKQALSKALLLGPNYMETQVGMADLAGFWGRLGEYDRALTLCSKVLQENPELYSGLYNCGNINLLTGHYDEAEKLLTRAVKIAPGQAPSLYWLGRVFMQTGRQQQAETTFRRAIEIDASDYQYHYWLAQALEMRGDINNAQEQYREVLKLNPDNADATLRLTALDAAR